MTYQVESFNKWLYPDDIANDNSKKSADLIAPRNGYASFQVLFNNCPVGEKINCSFYGTGKLFAEFYREIDVKVTMNTGVHGFTADYETAKDYVTRKAPFRVYDALEPVSDSIVKNKTEALYISFKIDENAVSGIYHCFVYIAMGAEKIEIPVNIEIADTVLPKESLYITNWYSVGSMAKSHGKELWSEEHWSLIEKYGKAMRRGRQNVFWITWDTVKSNIDEKGDYIFDFSRTERLIKMYLGMGFTVIEGSPLCGRDSWEAETFKISAPDGRYEAMSAQGYKYIVQFLTAWRCFLDKNGWYSKLIQHVGDEPHGKCSAEYRILAGIFRKCLPGVPLIEAVETYELRGAVDIWVPKNDYYARNRDELEKMRALGDRIWFYTCCIPGGFYMNRLLDMPLLRTRFLHWGNFKYNIEGFLHWGLNHWGNNQDPYEETCPFNGPTNHLPAGDSHNVYPGKDEPLISMRLEQMRAGAEDFELLTLLAKKDKKKADEIVDECFFAFDKCNSNSEDFDKVHKKLLEAL
jgi:hypothetical protein